MFRNIIFARMLSGNKQHSKVLSAPVLYMKDLNSILYSETYQNFPSVFQPLKANTD
jgi:hypothetical protein